MAEPVKRRMHKGRCFTALFILCCVLIFAVCQIVRIGKRGEEEAVQSLSETSVPETHPTLETYIADKEAVSYTVSTAKNFSTTEEHLYIRIGREKTIPLKILNHAITMEDIVWTSSDSSIASVDANGTVTAYAKGECMVYACRGEEEIGIPVTVREMVQEDGCTYVDGILVANKTYGLPEDYDPGLLPVTEAAFVEMQRDAQELGYDLYIGSDYRSYDDQVQSYYSMVEGYGKEYADITSARPGHSEHQTGYCIDCNTIDDAFGETELGQWVAAHCAEYGFIVRYPADKTEITGYAYESWHLRYVGVEIAMDITERGLCLEEYLDIDSVYQD